MSALSSKLDKLEKTLTPPTRWFSVTRTEVLLPDGAEVVLPVADSEMDRVRAEGYRPGIDQLLIVREFPEIEDLDDAALELVRSSLRHGVLKQ